MKMNPPLRTAADRKALIDALRDGTIDCVATDHAPHARDEKEVAFEQAPMGTTGLETAFAALHTELVLGGLLGPGGSSTGCAPAASRSASRGRGSRPASRRTSRSSTSPAAGSWGRTATESRSENCCFAGRELQGRVLLTVAAGCRRLPRALLRAHRRLMSAYVLLEDGTRFDGDAVGADGHAVGEVVFTTGMSGYQESMTDPSFAGQLITFTYPHIGNYGVRAGRHGVRPAVGARAIMREANDADDAPGAEGGWLHWLRDAGSRGSPASTPAASCCTSATRARCAAACSPATMPEREARELIEAEPSMAGRDLVREVTPEPA